MIAVSASAIAVLVQPLPAEAARKDAVCGTKGTDGVVDDDRTIQAQIDGSKVGDEIVITGPCVINSTVKLLDNRTYRGDSRTGTVIKQADNANLPAMFASESWVDNWTSSSEPVRVERLTLDGNRAKNTGTVGLMLRSWGSRVYDVEVWNAPSDGIRLSNPAKDGTTTLDNTMVNGIISDVYIDNSGGAGVRVLDPDGASKITDWTFTRSWVRDSGTSAVQSDNAAGWLITDLHLYGNAKNALDLDRCFGTSVQNNYIEDFGYKATTAVADYFGIRCTVQDGAASTISGNRIHNFRDDGVTLPVGPTFYYLALDGVNEGNGTVVVTGNAIRGAGGSAKQTGLLYKKGSGTSLAVTSTGNLVKYVTTAKTQSGTTSDTGI
ncbi:right-handed parallel beta-helix repeat-containing protein [Nonomuraea sp. NPDC002799]